MPLALTCRTVTWSARARARARCQRSGDACRLRPTGETAAACAMTGSSYRLKLRAKTGGLPGLPTDYIIAHHCMLSTVSGTFTSLCYDVVGINAGGRFDDR